MQEKNRMATAHFLLRGGVLRFPHHTPTITSGNTVLPLHLINIHDVSQSWKMAVVKIRRTKRGM